MYMYIYIYIYMFIYIYIYVCVLCIYTYLCSNMGRFIDFVYAIQIRICEILWQVLPNINVAFNSHLAIVNVIKCCTGNETGNMDISLYT